MKAFKNALTQAKWNRTESPEVTLRYMKLQQSRCIPISMESLYNKWCGMWVVTFKTNENGPLSQTINKSPFKIA